MITCLIVDDNDMSRLTLHQLALQTANSFLEQLGGASDSSSSPGASTSSQFAASDSIFGELGANDNAMDSMMLAAA